MKKIFCDICGKETYEHITIQILKNIYVHERNIDICKECYNQIFKKGGGIL